MNDFFSNVSFIKLLIKWKKQLIITVGAAIVLSAVFSGPYFIKPLYSSFAIIYPANILPYGNESQTEQMMQILQSDDINREMVNQFALLKHYNIDTTKKYYYTKVLKDLAENVDIEKTKYEAIKVKIWDTNPDTASAMVNAFLSDLDMKERSLQREKSWEVVKINKSQLDAKKKEMDSLEVRLKELSVKYGLLDYSAQTRETTRGLYELLSSGKATKSDINNAENVFRNLEEKGGEFIALQVHLGSVRSQYDDLKIKYENSLKDVKKKLTYSNIVSKPFPADKKSYPVRWLIVLVSTCLAFFFAVVIITVIDSKALSDK